MMRSRRSASLAGIIVVASTGAGLLASAPASGIYRTPPQSSHTICVHLSGRLGKTSSGPQGQTFTPIFLRNVGSEACTLTGVPGAADALGLMFGL